MASISGNDKMPTRDNGNATLFLADGFYERYCVFAEHNLSLIRRRHFTSLGCQPYSGPKLRTHN
jgi:hypothetical protein